MKRSLIKLMLVGLFAGGMLPAADMALIGKQSPELLAAGSRVSPFLGVTLSSRQPAVESLAVDSLGHGTFRVTGPGAVGYESGQTFVKVTFPAATDAMPRVEYRLEVTMISPSVAGIDGDPRFDGFKRNWLNVLQLNPSRRVLSNHAASDICALCYYKYADIE